MQYASLMAERGAQDEEAAALGVAPALVSRWANHLIRPSTRYRVAIQARHSEIELTAWDTDASEPTQGAA